MTTEAGENVASASRPERAPDMDGDQGKRASVRRVAICSVGELFGGVERHILGLVDALPALGVEPTVVLFHDGELARQVRERGISPRILPSSLRDTFRAAHAFAEILDAGAIDVAHVHGYKATVCAALACRRVRFGIVKTEHGLAERMPGRPIATLRERVYRWIDRFAAQRSNAAICYVSRELAAHFGATNHVDDASGTVIPNGVAALDSGDFPRPPEYPADGFIVLLVGRVDEVKGHDVAIDAFDDPSVPDDIVLFVLGDGPLRPALEAGLASRGLGGQVQFLGFRSNIFDYIAHCDVLTMPSRHEGLPYTLLEAMALERPVLASRVGGLAEVLADGETAVLVEQGKPAALREGLLRLYRDPALRARLGQQAGAERSRRYSLDAMARRYLDIYRSTTGG